MNSLRAFCGSLAASRWDEVLVRGPQGQIKSSYPASFSPGSAILKQVGVVLIYVCVTNALFWKRESKQNNFRNSHVAFPM